MENNMQTIRTMTVHEALCEVKVAEKRINKILSGAAFIGKKKVADKKVSGIDRYDFEKNAISDYDSVTSIIRNVENIKSALSLSNAQTKITVAGKEMSIAEAVYELNYGIVMKENLLGIMLSQYKRLVSELDDLNGPKLDAAAERYINSNFSQKDKVDGNVLREAEEEYRKRNTWDMIDPLELKDKIDSLQDQIDSFRTAVDSAIQVSNAKTLISIPV